MLESYLLTKPLSCNLSFSSPSSSSSLHIIQHADHQPECPSWAGINAREFRLWMLAILFP